MMIANVVQMAYIATNHLFCDETGDVNDPLLNSLSVSVPRWLGWLHLNFGYHVEHHIFPYMNSRHAPRVRSAIEARYGKRYHTLPILTAISVLYRTPPVHLSQKELVNLESGDVYSTLGQEGDLPHQIEQVAVPVRPRRRAAAIGLYNRAMTSPQNESAASPAAMILPAAELTKPAEESLDANSVKHAA
jgi:hypothetical protein